MQKIRSCECPKTYQHNLSNCQLMFTCQKSVSDYVSPHIHMYVYIHHNLEQKKAFGTSFSLFQDKAEVIMYFSITSCTTKLQDNAFLF